MHTHTHSASVTCVCALYFISVYCIVLYFIILYCLVLYVKCYCIVLYFILYFIVLYCIVYAYLSVNLSKSTQCAAGLKALKPAANGHYFTNVQIMTLLFPFTVQNYMYPPVSKVHAGSFRVSVIHRTLTWTTGSLTCVRDHSCARIYIICIRASVGHTDHESAQHFLLGKPHVFLCSSVTRFEPRAFEVDALPIEPPRHPHHSRPTTYTSSCSNQS